MTTQQRSTIVGVFEDRRHADQAVADLKAAGFRDDQIGVAMRHDEEMGTHTAGESHTDEASGAGTGAMTGALAGLGLGALAGLGVLAGVIPVVGPAITAGTLGVILTNAAAGAGIVGLAGALIGYGMPEEEARYYESEFEAGRTIVTVHADGRAEEARSIMHRHGAYDMGSRGTATGMTSEHAHAHQDRGAMQVKEEQLHAEKHPVETGEVHVRKEVHTEHKTLDVPVMREEVVIERTPAHGQTAAAGEFREGEMHIPVREERVDVTKTPVVTEEVRVGKKVVQDTEHVAADVRKEEVKIEREGDVDVRDRDRNRGTR